MSEFCLECWNRVMGTSDEPGKFIISKELDLCEACGKMKPVIIRVKWRYVLKEWLSDCKERFGKI